MKNLSASSHLRVFALSFLLFTLPLNAQSLPPCFDRDTDLDRPWVDGARWCLELVADDPDAGPLGFTALAAAPDGTLYAARPFPGQIYALTDTDGDLLPDTPRLVADGLTMPNGLAYSPYDDALYISGGAHIYRLKDGEIETVVDDVPSGSGFWTGGLLVGPDARLYLGTGAPCDACASSDRTRGAILTYRLDGGEPELFATGLRQPADLALVGTQLWTVDSARDALAMPDMDELNAVYRGADLGFPRCIGRQNIPDLDFNNAVACNGVTPPAFAFPTHSTPLGLAAYTSDTFPSLAGTLLVVLSGSVNQAYMEGYALVAVHFDEGGQPINYEPVVPSQTAQTSFTLQEINYRTSGIYPRRPLDVAVSPEGWIYLSVGYGRILAVRPP